MSATLNPNIFRAYDIRGVAERDLTTESVVPIANSFAAMLVDAGSRDVALGRDVRASSPRIAEVFRQALSSAGLQVYDLGIVSTPMLYYGVSRFQRGGGVMITASHNPSPDNGLKLLINDVAISGDRIQEIYQGAQAGRKIVADGGAVHTTDILDTYVTELTEQACIGPRALKIAVDGGNGMSGPSITRLLDRLGIEHIDLYCDPDGDFPNHHPDPTQIDTLVDLQRTVLEHGCDLGLAFDGDGDRIGVVDEEGRVIHGDRLVIIYAREILKEVPGARIVGEVKCSDTLFSMIEKWGGDPIMSRVGHSFIKATLRENGALLAGEMSGHMFFKHRYYGFDDAVYAAMRLLEIASNVPEDAPFSTLLADVPDTVTTPEIRVDCPDISKFGVVDSVVSHFRALRPVEDIDGARIRFENGWGLVRASNTQPVLVLRFEATTDAELNAYQSEIMEVVTAAISACDDSV
ncbi:MAG: phosphomannomutase [Myxococcales bacterium]|nr:phosphomannomutase [Myxococcales bacterium]